MNPPISSPLEQLHTKVAAALPDINVERDAYCIGYWARRAGLDFHESSAGRGREIEWFGDGWNDADAEIREENGS